MSAGGLIAVLGVEAAYALDVVTFLLAMLLVAGMSASRPDRQREGLASVREGFQLVRQNRLVATILGLDFTAMLFGMPLALLPALTEQLGAGPGVLGLLYAAPAAGGLIAAAFSGTAGRARRAGLGVLLALFGWSAGIVLVGLANVTWLAGVGLAIAGAGNQVSALLGGAITQSAVDDEVRGTRRHGPPRVVRGSRARRRRVRRRRGLVWRRTYDRPWRRALVRRCRRHRCAGAPSPRETLRNAAGF